MTIGYRETDSRVFTQAVIFRGGGGSSIVLYSSIRPSVRPSVHLYAYISEVPPGRISMEFDIGEFYENVTRKYKFS